VVTVRGRLIVFEGGEASGKSTQATRLAERLGAVLTREPGGTPTGQRLRELLLDPASGHIDQRAEALLMAADRAQHVAEKVRPALEAGQHVVSDRFIGSTLAYQGHGRGLDVEWLRTLSRFATDGLDADLVLLLDLDPQVAEARRTDAPDRLEQAGDAFHRAVAEGYRALAAADPEHWVVIDGAAPVDEVSAAVDAAVLERLGLAG
jgi:dTMP kinase